MPEPITLNLSENHLTRCNTKQSVKLSCRYSPVFLTLLLKQAGEAVSAKTLCATIQRHNPSFRLHRNQVLRMLNDITRAFTALSLDITIYPQKKQRSTGPWTLSATRRIILDSLDTLEMHNGESINTPLTSQYFDWKAIPISERPRVFHDFLEMLLTAEIMAHEGYVAEVAKILSDYEQFPVTPALRLFLDLHRARFLAKSGDYEAARRLATDVLALAEQKGEQRFISLASFFLFHWQYVQAPDASYSMLLQHMPEPTTFTHQDDVTVMYWHNLQALLLRRQALAHPDEALTCHERALCHFETCIIDSIRMNNAECTLDFITNVAFHLQELLALGLTQIEDVFLWYQLAISHADKLGGGGHSAWDRIFFTQFICNTVRIFWLRR